jgi:hypothetical protein
MLIISLNYHPLCTCVSAICNNGSCHCLNVQEMNMYTVIPSLSVMLPLCALCCVVLCVAALVVLCRVLFLYWRTYGACAANVCSFSAMF